MVGQTRQHCISCIMFMRLSLRKKRWDFKVDIPQSKQTMRSERLHKHYTAAPVYKNIWWIQRYLARGQFNIQCISQSLTFISSLKRGLINRPLTNSPPDQSSFQGFHQPSLINRPSDQSRGVQYVHWVMHKC